MKVMTLLKRKGVSVKMVLSWKRSSRSTAVWKIMKERARSARTDKYRTRAAATSFGRDSTDSTAIAMMAPSTGVLMAPTAALLPGERLAFYAGPSPSPKFRAPDMGAGIYATPGASYTRVSIVPGY